RVLRGGFLIHCPTGYSENSEAHRGAGTGRNGPAPLRRGHKTPLPYRLERGRVEKCDGAHNPGIDHPPIHVDHELDDHRPLDFLVEGVVRITRTDEREAAGRLVVATEADWDRARTAWPAAGLASGQTAGVAVDDTVLHPLRDSGLVARRYAYGVGFGLGRGRRGLGGLDDDGRVRRNDRGRRRRLDRRARPGTRAVGPAPAAEGQRQRRRGRRIGREEEDRRPNGGDPRRVRDIERNEEEGRERHRVEGEREPEAGSRT